MPKPLAHTLLLICVLTICGCTAAGPTPKRVLAICPPLPPVPAHLMRPPATEQKVRLELFELPPSATRK